MIVTLAAAAAAVAQSVVLVATPLQSEIKTGSGFVLESSASKTRILTANHVIEGGAVSFVFVGGAHGTRYPASVIRADRLRDIALLEIQVGGLAPVVLGDVAIPPAGTDVSVSGYPTGPEPDPAASPIPSSEPPKRIPFDDLKLVSSKGTVDGETELGESALLNLAVTHGDSGAPVVDAKGGRVIAMVLGLAGGYGTESWMSGDGLGLSVNAIQAFLNPVLPDAASIKPAFSVTMESGPEKAVPTTWDQLGRSAGFTPYSAGHPAGCRDEKGSIVANASIKEVEESNGTAVSFTLSDCSGAQLYDDQLISTGDSVLDLTRLIGRRFLGYVDSHRPEWISLLKYGIAADPQKNPYLSLMSVSRNPFGQLVVDSLFRGGPADRAGIKQGDAILKIDGRPTRNLGAPFVYRLLNQPSATLLLFRNLHRFEVKLHPRRFADLVASGPIPR